MDAWFETQGYRKIAGDACQGGVDLSPVRHDCPPSSERSIIGAAIVYIVFCFVLGVCCLACVSAVVVVAVVVLRPRGGGGADAMDESADVDWSAPAPASASAYVPQPTSGESPTRPACLQIVPPVEVPATTPPSRSTATAPIGTAPLVRPLAMVMRSGRTPK